MTFLIINYSIINKLQYNIITLWIMKGVIFKTNSAREGACNMRIFDLHSDLFTDIAWRKSLGEKNIFDRIHYPNLQKGGVESVICVFWVEPKFRNRSYKRFQTIFSYVMEDLKSSKHAIIKDPTLSYETQHDPNKINVFLGLEGLTFMGGWTGKDIYSKIESGFNELNQDKVLHAIFSWNEHNFISTGTGTDSAQDKGLTKAGKFAVQQTINNNWILDVSHQDKETFWDMYNVDEKQPLMASHSNAKAICDHERNLTDGQIKAVAARGGRIGLNAYGEFVHKEKPNVERFIDHAIHISTLVGYECLAFGFDLLAYLKDSIIGGNKFTSLTKGLEDVTKVPGLLEKMLQRGFSDKELEAICFTNASQFMQKYFQT